MTFPQYPDGEPPRFKPHLPEQQPRPPQGQDQDPWPTQPPRQMLYGQPYQGQYSWPQPPHAQQPDPDQPDAQRTPYAPPLDQLYQPHTPLSDPPRRRRRALTFLALAAVFLLIAGVTFAIRSRELHAASPAAVRTAATSAAASFSSAPAPHTVATFTGSGQEITPQFTVTSTWQLVYSFNCEAFGSQGIFQVNEDSGTDFSLSVNDLAMSMSATRWAYDDSGTHYLQINSECAWKVQIVDEP
jgi:hypothetical protein